MNNIMQSYYKFIKADLMAKAINESGHEMMAK